MNEQEQIALLQTIVACLIEECCNVTGLREVRIQRCNIEDPPEIEADDDPYTGEWIYRLSGESLPETGGPR